jgi:hypothetical protein
MRGNASAVRKLLKRITRILLAVEKEQVVSPLKTSTIRHPVSAR